jgi:hypothetical protein
MRKDVGGSGRSLFKVNLSIFLGLRKIHEETQDGLSRLEPGTSQM